MAELDNAEQVCSASKFKKCCNSCGGENVMRDAWAAWNAETQEWELSSIFDAAFCDDCGGETHLVDKPL